MKLNYNWMALLCVGLSVPLVYHLATRNQRGGRPSVRFASYNLALNRPEAGGLLAEQDALPDVGQEEAAG